jgi:ElaB/YqjD/DUF883 family membrane-anchored ribosome-binding protein
MSTATNFSQNAREASKATAAGSDDIQKDLQALRDDFARLADQVGVLLNNKGNAAWQRAMSSVDGVVADAQGKGQEAVDAVREVTDHFADAVDESLKTRPYTTLALVAALGFIFGAIWRR